MSRWLKSFFKPLTGVLTNIVNPLNKQVNDIRNKFCNPAQPAYFVNPNDTDELAAQFIYVDESTEVNYAADGSFICIDLDKTGDESDYELE